MKHFKIGIVEDEGITTELIIRSLRKLNYKIAEPASCYAEAIEMIQKEKPDLLLIDINLNEERDGIYLANYIKDNVGTPFIFLTANGDSATINRAKSSCPLAFLIKPFTPVDLHAAIEIGWNNFNTILHAERNSHKHIVVKVGTAFEKIVLDDIAYLKSDNHYFDIYFTCGKKIVVRYTASEIIALLPAKQFVKINRFYIVNVKQVTKIDKKHVLISQLTIPVSKEVRETLLQKI